MGCSATELTCTVVATLFAGCGIWFREHQKNGGHKDAPAVVLWVQDGCAIVIIARGTSQAYDRGGFCSDGALEFGPMDPVGKRLSLTQLTRFRSNDVKRIEIEQVVKTCGQIPRGDWKRLNQLTEMRVAGLAQAVLAPSPVTETTSLPSIE